MELQETVVIELNSSSASVDYVAIVDYDEVVNVNSLGEPVTTYGPGETYGIWLHLSSNVKVDSAEVTSGSIVAKGSASRNVTEQVFFSGKDEPTEHTTSIIPSSSSLNFYGNVGNPSQLIQEHGIVTYKGEDILNVPYIADITNTFAVQLFEVTAPEVDLTDEESYPQGIVFYISER